MNHIPEHFAAHYETKYKFLMLRSDFAINLAKHADEIESIISEAN
jgi:hypothetical protein